MKKECKLITQLNRKKFEIFQILQKNEHKYPEDSACHYFNIFGN